MSCNIIKIIKIYPDNYLLLPGILLGDRPKNMRKLLLYRYVYSTQGMFLNHMYQFDYYIL